MYMKEYDYLVVGAGLFAAVFVRQAIDAGKRCLVIDKRSHIGGNIYCENVRWHSCTSLRSAHLSYRQ